MFDLEKSIAEWRQQMLAAGIKQPVPLEELESHLRENIEQQMRSGLNAEKAFESAVQNIGQAKPLKIEFKKIDAGNWNRPLALIAWILFVISFFLPALGDGLGWQCAGLSATAVFLFWPVTGWMPIHLELLTLANLLMVASPFLLPRFSLNARSLQWLRCSSLAALVLVWSFLLFLVSHSDAAELKFGCYVWGLSFLPLCLSTFKIRSRKTLAAKYV